MWRGTHSLLVGRQRFHKWQTLHEWSGLRKSHQTRVCNWFACGYSHQINIAAAEWVSTRSTPAARCIHLFYCNFAGRRRIDSTLLFICWLYQATWLMWVSCILANWNEHSRFELCYSLFSREPTEPNLAINIWATRISTAKSIEGMPSTVIHKHI